jgi:glycosyltransferase involved in cell wall biosynthesis
MSNLNDVSAGNASDVAHPPRKVRVAYFVTHPIQYQAPMLRRIACENDIDLRVFFSSDISVRGYSDMGFGGIQVRWDVPLLDGYSYEFLPGFRKDRMVSFATPLNYGILSRLRRGGFDAVWVHGYYNFNCLRAILAAWLLRIPVILRSEAPPNDRIRSKTTHITKRLFFKILRQAIHCFAAIGKAHVGYWQHYLGSDMPIFFMPYAVDNHYFASRATDASRNRETLRQELGLEVSHPVFLFASKLQARKRCIDLVDAFLQLSPAPGVEPPAYLLIIGDGDERSTIEKRVQESGFSNVRMLGFKNQSELPRFFDLCEVFILPATHENWGLIVNEVMNTARAVVVSDQVGCHVDLVEEGKNGFVFPAGDVDALSAILRRFVENSLLARAMGQQGPKTIARYSFEEDVRGLRQALAFCVPGFVA